MESRTKRLGVNTILVFLGKAGSSLIGLLMLPFYTHWLTPADYGTTDLVFTFTSILVSVLSCCMADSLFIYAKGASEDDSKKYYSTGLLFLIVSSIIFVVVTLVVRMIGYSFDIVGVIFEHAWFILAITVCNALQLYTQAFTQAIDKMKVFTLTGIVFTISIALSSFVLLPTMGLTGYLWSYVFANVVSSVFSLVMSKSYRYLSIGDFDRSKCRELLSYGIPIIPNTIMWWLVSGINRPIMESKLGLAAIGVFAVANKIPAVISMLCGIFNTAWSITMLEEYGKADFNEFFNKVVKSIYLALVLAGVAISIFSQEIISIFAAKDFFAAWRYVPFLVLSVLLQNLSGLIGGVFSAQKKSKYFFYSSIWGAATSLIFTFLLISWLGIYGVCLAMIISFFSMIVSRLKYAWKEIDRFNIKYYVALTILYLSLALTVVSDLRPLMKVPIYMIVIAAMLWLSKDIIDSCLLLLTRNRRCNQ